MEQSKTTAEVKYFAHPQSIVRRIWGDADVVLFIFAGAAAEFALNRAVDWLYFTGKLPADPIGRLFSTVLYAHKIIYAPEQDAHRAIDAITAIHHGVEAQRGQSIPAWAYRDVLYMLIGFSEAAWQVLQQPLTAAEQQELYDVFYRMGVRMGIGELPATYSAWLTDRARHRAADLIASPHTTDLFRQYRNHLGWLRYTLMRQVQYRLLPANVARQLKLKKNPALQALLRVYAATRRLPPVQALRYLLLPRRYRSQVMALELPATTSIT